MQTENTSKKLSEILKERHISPQKKQKKYLRTWINIIYNKCRIPKFVRQGN